VDEVDVDEDWKVIDNSRIKRHMRWTDDEHRRFVEAVRKHGRDWSKVTQAVGTRD